MKLSKPFKSLSEIRIYLIRNGTLEDKRGNILAFDLKNERFNFGIYQKNKYEILQTEWI
jgi:hypothetical protein